MDRGIDEGLMAMRNVLDVDGPFYRGLSRFGELILLSLIWAVLSLPVVSAPVATGWLCHAVRVTRADEPIPAWRPTLHHLRTRFVPSLRLAAALTGVVTLVLIAMLGPNPGGWYGQLIFVTGGLVAVTTALVAPWAVALLDQCLDVRTAIRVAYRRAVRRMSLALLSTVALVTVPAVAFAGPAWLRLVALLVAPAFAAAVVTRLCDLAGSQAPTTGSAPEQTRYGRPCHDSSSCP